jgi:ferredoxin-NADP reductase
MAMLRLHAETRSDVDARLLMSSRDWDDVIYREELAKLADPTRVVVHTLTQSQPPGWRGHARRVDPEMLAEIGPTPAERPHIYVCGPTPFVETVAQGLVQLGHRPEDIRTERFGATGE